MMQSDVIHLITTNQNIITLDIRFEFNNC